MEFLTLESIVQAAIEHREQQEKANSRVWSFAAASYTPLSFQATDGENWIRQYYQFGDYLLRPAFRLFSSSSSHLLEPPQPAKRPLIGNLLDVLPNMWLNSIALHEQLGPIYKLELGNFVIHITKNIETLEQVFNIPDKRFPSTTFGQPTIACKGVFIADGQRWEFGRDAMQRNLTTEMVDQFVPEFVKFARQLHEMGKSQLPGPFDVMDWIERLTYDVICKVGFGYNSGMLTMKEKEPFIQVFDEILQESIRAQTQLPLLTWLSLNEFMRKMNFLNESLDKMIHTAQTKDAPPSLLKAIIGATCPRTKRSFDQDELRHQLITVLVAGHKTTTLLLTWSLWYIAENPQVEDKLLEELQRVFADDIKRDPTAEDLKKLPYMDMFLKEVLRIACPVQSVQRGIHSPTTLGKYTLAENSHIVVNVRGIHMDEKLWGPDVKEFNPDRFKDMSKFHPYQFIPFGGGKRLCLGNLFALTQVKSHLCLLLRTFHVRTVTGKPITVAPKDISTPVGGVWLKAFPRTSFSPAPSLERSAVQPVKVLNTSATWNNPTDSLTILYGSNYGTTKDLADKLKRQAEEADFTVDMSTLDECGVAGLASKSLVLIIVCTYNGFPAENAKKFVQDLQEWEKTAANKKPFKNLTYAVFSSGNSNWHATYQRVGITIDQAMSNLGANKLMQMTIGDKARDFNSSSSLWRDTVLRTLGVSREKAGTNATHIVAPSPWLSVEPASGSTFAVPAPTDLITQAATNKERFIQGHFGYSPCALVESQEVVSPTKQDPHRRVLYLRFKLPEGTQYKPGDHLEIMPTNSAADVEWLCKRLEVDPKAAFVASSQGQRKKAAWGMGHVALLGDLLTLYSTITAVPSREDLAVMASYATDKSEKDALLDLLVATDKGLELYNKKIVDNRVSFLQVLKDYPSIKLPLARALEIFPAKIPRLYSIASSPTNRPNECAVCVGIVSYNTPDGKTQNGLATSLLAGLKPPQTIYAKVRSVAHMHLPSIDTPIVCVSGGTGIAPFLGYFEHRQQERSESKSPAKDMLFFGCRGEYDIILKNRLVQWHSNNNLGGLHIALSREEGKPKVYVQHMLMDQKDAVKQLLLQERGYLYICGSSSMANDVTKNLITILGEDNYKDLLQKNFILLDVWG